MTLYNYGMSQRPFSLGAQPNGVEVWEDGSEGYWSYVYYKTELTEQQVKDYELTYLGEIKTIKL